MLDMSKNYHKTVYTGAKWKYCEECGKPYLQDDCPTCPDCNSCDPEGTHRFDEFYLKPEKELVF